MEILKQTLPEEMSLYQNFTDCWSLFKHCDSLICLYDNKACKKIQTQALTHNFVENKEMEKLYHFLVLEPFVKVIENVNQLIEDEAPLNLRYLLFTLHDFQLA